MASAAISPIGNNHLDDVSERSETKPSSELEKKSTESSAADLSRHLAEAKKAGHGMRMKISGTAGSLGVTLAATSLVIQSLNKPGSIEGYLGAILAAPAVMLILTAVLPTDKKLITWTGRLLVFFSLLSFLFCMMIAVSVAGEDKDCCYCDTEQGDMEVEKYYCEWMPVWWILTGLLILTCSGILMSGQKLPPRAKLLRMWKAIGATFVGMSFIRLLDYCVGAPAGYYDSVTPLKWVLSIVLTLTFFAVGGFCLNPNTRIKAHAALSARGEQVATAAAIAAMMGGKNPKFVQAEGRRKFRCITLDKITREEMAESSPNPALASRAENADFGDVDAFLSHSWSDCSQSKWAALQQWRTEFKTKHFREPRVWIDKCCIDQRDIDANLMCLPVFLSGCKTILCTVGRTYLSRLWCILEIFVFFEMGADVDRVDLRLISDKDVDGKVDADSVMQSEREGLVSAFDTFNAEQAACFDMNQRERLLAIVEAGFGGIDYFNQALRDILHKVKGLDDEEGRSLQICFRDSAVPELISPSRDSFAKRAASWRPSFDRRSSSTPPSTRSDVRDQAQAAAREAAIAAAADVGAMEGKAGAATEAAGGTEEGFSAAADISGLSSCSPSSP